jgi:hypothetical protein
VDVTNKYNEQETNNEKWGERRESNQINAPIAMFIDFI